MVKRKNFNPLRFIILIFLLCPMLIVTGCSCTGYSDGKKYGSYNVTFYLEGKEYASLTSDKYGYFKWPTKPQKDNHWFDGWYFDSDYNNKHTSDKYRTYKDVSFYGKFVEYVVVDCVTTMFGGYIGRDDDIEDHYVTYMAKGSKILEELESSNVYNHDVLHHNYHGLFLGRDYDWCGETKQKTLKPYTTTVNTIYDDCNPFAMIDGEFGSIDKLPVHEVSKPYMYIQDAISGVANILESFLDRFEIPTDGTEYVRITDEIQTQAMESMFNSYISRYTNSLAPVTRTDESKRDFNQSIILGLNYPYAIVTKNGFSYNYYHNQVAKLFGYADANEFVESAKKLASTYEIHRQNLINESEDTNLALNNGCFYTDNGSFVFPMAIKNQYTPILLTYVIVDVEGRVSFWINDMETLRRAISDFGAYFIDQTIDNKIYCKNTLFIKGATYQDEINEDTILDNELISKGNYNQEDNRLTIYLKHTLSQYSITYDLGRYADRCDNSHNPKTFTTHDFSEPLHAPKTDGSILFGGWMNKDDGKIYETIRSGTGHLRSMDLKAVWLHFKESNDQKSVEFGYYPQSLKAEDVEILDENNPETTGVFKGYYKGSDGCYYEKLTATLYDNAESITLQNGTLENGKTYYFKVEPITWDYISTAGTAYDDGDDDTDGIISRYVLDYSTYDELMYTLDGAYSKMLSKRWCTDLHSKEFEGYNDSKVTISYDECSPFSMITNEFGDIKDIPNTASSVVGHSAFHDLGIKLDDYIITKSEGAYRDFDTQAYRVFTNYALLNFVDNANIDASNSVFIDFKKQEYKYNSSVETNDQDVLKALANLLGLNNQTELKNYAELIASKCERLGYEALENAYVRTIRNSYVFPFAIYNSPSQVVLMHLIVDSSRNVYLWANSLQAVLRLTNYSSSYRLSGDITNMIFCKNMLFIAGHTPSFTADQLNYYVEKTLLSPTYGQGGVGMRRPKIATDYAIAKGIDSYSVTFSNESNNFADWWLSSRTSSGTQFVSYNGVLSQATSEYCGVVPFLMLNRTPFN